MTRVLVCGGRDYEDWLTLKRTLDHIHIDHTITAIIHGGATGADAMADDWAKSRGITIKAYPVTKEEWRMIGLSAGPRRNARMLKTEQPDMVVAFPGNKGTADMATKAFDAGYRKDEAASLGKILVLTLPRRG